MNLAALISRLSFRLSPAERAQFRAEQQCSIGFAGLRPVRRVFLEV